MTEIVLTEAGVTADAEQFGREIAEIAAAGIARAQDEAALAEQGDRAARSIAAKAAHLHVIGWPDQAITLWRQVAVASYSRAARAPLHS